MLLHSLQEEFAEGIWFGWDEALQRQKIVELT